MRSGPPKAVNRDFSRRHLLGALGASAAALPFLPLLERESAAAAGDYPTRIVLLFSSNGCLHEKWAPTAPTANDFELNEMMLPLQRHKDKLVILDGLRIEHVGPGDAHQQGMAKLWSGSTLTEDGPWAGGITIDQAIANEIGDKTRYKSLEFGVLSTLYQNGTSIFSRMSYQGPRQPVSPVEDPAEMYRRLFADIGVGDDRLQRLQAERRSVLDLIKDDLAELNPKYSSRDRQKLESHLQAIRELEMRNDAPIIVCEQPSAPDASIDAGANAELPRISRAMIDQLVMALTCDVTRVASLQWTSVGSIETYDFLGLTPASGETHHHGFGHLPDDDPNMVHYMTTVQAFYSGELAYMLDLMSQVPEGDGTLLDNTVIIWGNELARGNAHSKYPMPFLMAGGAGGRVKMGRYLDFGDTQHHRLLVSLCQLMGLGVESFGNEDTGTGALSGLIS